ncbi:mutS1: DNA mismatch repair protein MutS [Rubrobacter radiotolerans]|uniref:DNA mismatch repair protein MutS n=1 Tax=Rubrobacter radiotolerans TaxID=42256 RepID=A0A023WZQ9_RUBRA|nr:DNA mismatch repair protein MutS [Rubrobacter radiotolerans]AHY45441.1 mutS1: DNA mismatch repair protein MutS [Rubrobacter radiotolerans]MDX5892852.1 DNA mismatch repair protein MutS [Rubrobacter radiotolerans]SMC02627.1 DNA mismatch repair protein MutS [Rubrobacter radiotolerans DSM 5868]
MLGRYAELKAQLPPETILFYQVGTFFETFEEDAKKLSKALSIRLTSREAAGEGRVPLAGVPAHSLGEHLASLLRQGYSVAVAEQRPHPTKPKQFVREISQVLTPGTVIEDNVLAAGHANYLAAFVVRDGKAGLAVVEASTGEFTGTEVDEDDLPAELERWSPRELVVPERTTVEDLPKLEAKVSSAPRWTFEPSAGEQTLRRHFGVANLRGFDLEGSPALVGAAGALLQYLASLRGGTAPEQVVLFRRYRPGQTMLLDAATRRNLGLEELIEATDRTKTAMGERALRRWMERPLLDADRIEQRLDAVAAFADDYMAREETRELLSRIPDVERLATRIVRLSASPNDLLSLRGALEAVGPLRETLAGLPADLISRAASALEEPEGVRELIVQAISDEPGETIRPGYSRELDEAREFRDGAHDWLTRFEADERVKTGLKSLKVGYRDGEGYFIEVAGREASKVPANYEHRKALKHNARYVTVELKEHESRMLGARDEVERLEREILAGVRAAVKEAAPDLQRIARAVAVVDVLASFAACAGELRYCRPTVTEERGVRITGGRHPVVEGNASTLSGTPFVPNDAEIDGSSRLQIITGPNMAGKSVYLRQVAIIALMAQVGCYVPADSATLGVVDRIFTRVGAEDRLASGESTFMVEMTEAASILNSATERSLVILDEVGRGTSTYDGMSLAWAIAEYLHDDVQSLTLFATHYHELTRLEESLPGCRNYRAAVEEVGGEVVFLHRIEPGAESSSYGVHVARLAGLPDRVTDRAGEILSRLEAEGVKDFAG